jgi:hypothetical protein
MKNAAPESFFKRRNQGIDLGRAIKKADVADHLDEVFRHVGLLVNGPSSEVGVPFN